MNDITRILNYSILEVIDYCSVAWKFKQFNKTNTVQNRTIRYFLGVHRFTPLLAINGEMG